MPLRSLFLSSLALAATLLSANAAWALGFELSETKEQLKLKYEVAVTDHGTGRVAVTLTIADEGRLAPLSRGVNFVIPSKDGTGYVDLAFNMERRQVDGKQVMSVQLQRELAERATIQLQTDTLDGKHLALTWYYHAIPVKDYLKAVTPEGK
jgi:hypothetical protein